MNTAIVAEEAELIGVPLCGVDVALSCKNFSLGKWDAAKELSKYAMIEGVTWYNPSLMMTYRTGDIIIRFKFKSDSNFNLIETIEGSIGEKFYCFITYGCREQHSIVMIRNYKLLYRYNKTTITRDSSIDSVEINYDLLSSYPMFRVMDKLPFNCNIKKIREITKLNKAIGSLSARWYFDC